MESVRATPALGGAPAEAHSLAAWDVALGRSVCASLETALEREWLATNGIGGYAMGSLAGATTRRYHGLLVAALRPPVARTVLVTKVDEELRLRDGQTIALGTNQYADGTINPAGYAHLEEFALEGSVARFRFDLPGGDVLEKRIWMEHRRNTTFVRYHLPALPAASPAQDRQGVVLTLAPFCVSRDYHAHQHGSADWRFQVEEQSGGLRVRAWDGAPTVHLLAGPAARFTAAGTWYWSVLHRAERERGLDDVEDVYLPGTLQASLAPGATLTLVISAEDEPGAAFGTSDHEVAATDALERERARARSLLARAAGSWGAAAPLSALPRHTLGSDEHAVPDDEPADRKEDVARSVVDAEAPAAPVLGRLVLAADQFLVSRSTTGSAGEAPGATILAGYPWFTDWGRDTMIALAGLTLATGRAEVARDLLRTFARFLDRGMLPNRFPDSGEALTDADYNTADATLWYFVALDRYVKATRDDHLLAELFPALAGVVRWHEQGTRFGIGVDPRDGLLRAGAPGVQLTWMDAKVGDWVVTPRRGKPVEINGLWHNALGCMAEWAAQLGQPPEPYEQARMRLASAFEERFWDAAGGYYCDVVDVEGVDGAVDVSVRPNQVIAMALRYTPMREDHMRAALAVVDRHLLTPLGLRTLSPEDPTFVGHYRGDQRARDGAYHQGTAWPWLIGPYLDARLRLERDPAERQRLRSRLLAPFRDHLLAAGVGSISEIAEPLAPFQPVGCTAQAWSAAEVLRVWTATGN